MLSGRQAGKGTGCNCPRATSRHIRPPQELHASRARLWWLWDGVVRRCTNASGCLFLMRSICSRLDALAVKVLIFKKDILKSSPNHCIYLQGAERVCSIACRKEKGKRLSPPALLGSVGYALQRGELSRERGGSAESWINRGVGEKLKAQLWARGGGRSPSSPTADLLQSLEGSRAFLRASASPPPTRG